MPDNRYNQNRYQDEGQARANNGLSSTVKGIIAIMLTLLVVVIVIMIFAKNLFINDNTTPKKTGVITSTEYVPPATTTTEETTTTTKKTTKKTEEEDDPYDENEDDQQGTVNCISAVYLHPEPTSSSENLLTIPAGAECKYFRNDNGWYYVEYNGTQGYAWNTFFSAPGTSAE